MEKKDFMYRYTLEFFDTDGVSYEVIYAEWPNKKCAYQYALLKLMEMGPSKISIYEYDLPEPSASYHEIGYLTA